MKSANEIKKIQVQKQYLHQIKKSELKTHIKNKGNKNLRSKRNNNFAEFNTLII